MSTRESTHFLPANPVKMDWCVPLFSVDLEGNMLAGVNKQTKDLGSIIL